MKYYAWSLTLWMIWIGWAGTVAADDAADFTNQLTRGGRILLIRHAFAPGSGDPDHFKIGDCSTQRNLSNQGRRQARQIGAWLHHRGVRGARVYSSQWCRCLETARLLGLGEPEELQALNSFFQRPQDRRPNLTALREFISRQPPDGELIVMVTHYVTIAGITDRTVSSGGAVLLGLSGDGGYRVLGESDLGHTDAG